jgi:hypothetical protein
VFFVATKSDKGTANIKQSEIEFAMRNSAVASMARPFLYVETSAKNRKFTDDLFVKAVYSALFDYSKVEQKKGPAMQAAQKLAQIEEMRRAQKPPSLPSKPAASAAVPAPPRLGKTNSSAEVRGSLLSVVTSLTRRVSGLWLCCVCLLLLSLDLCQVRGSCVHVSLSRDVSQVCGCCVFLLLL